jgi:hypothetical protein
VSIEIFAWPVGPRVFHERTLMRNVALLLALALSSTAIAQPMMIDPSKMSGIPRPDPQVPPKTITVRLIRGELSNRLVGLDVQLADGKGQVLTAKTDAEGRATFKDLTPGQQYQARASDGKEELTSQPIDLPNELGVRVMLVFAAAGGGAAADGAAHADKTLPAGTVLVRAVGEGGTPLPGLEVVLGHARAGESGVIESRAKTDAKGEAKLTGNDAKPTSGYLVEVLKDGARFASKPFRLQENMGSTVVVDVRPVSRDLGALKMDANSHVIFDIQDDVVQVIEVLHIVNSSSQAIDPGGGGLHLTLPAKALQAGPGPQNPPTFSVTGHTALLRGPIPPGQTDIQLMYLLAYDSSTLEFAQRTPIAWDQVSLVTEKIDGLDIVGNGLERTEREVQGRKLLIFAGPGVKAGDDITLHLVGLPHANTMWRYLAVAVMALLLVGFGIYAAGGGRARDRLGVLEMERERLLSELVALEQKQGSDKKRDARKEELTARLAKVYRELDEVIR